MRNDPDDLMNEEGIRKRRHRECAAGIYGSGIDSGHSSALRPFRDVLIDDVANSSVVSAAGLY